MNWKDWLFPWRAKAKIEELQACLNRSVDAAPFTAKINLLEERLEQTIKSLKAALDEKHACATLLSSTRASEQDWRETANKIDLEKNELASLNRTLVDQLEHAKADVEEWKGRVKVERKEREDVEKAIGGMKAEVMEAHTLAAKASKLQEALDHEIAEHRLAKEQVVGLTKWIRVAHRLDSPSPKGTIRRILQSARFRTTSRSGTVTAMALVCFAWTALAQAPFWRNPWSTNQAPPVIGTNLWVSNTASGDGWFFYNQPNSNVVARLRDITAATASGTNFNGINVTNRALIGDLQATNSATTTNLTNWGHQTWKFEDSFGVWRNVILDASIGFGYPTFSLGFDNVLFADPANNTQGMLFGNINTNLGVQDIIVGSQNTANGDQDNVFGYFNYVSGDYSGAFGNYNYTTNNTNYVLGANVTNTTPFSVEVGPVDSSKVRISALGLNSLNLPMVSTNTTNFGALVFPPANTALSSNDALGTWTVSGSNGNLNILSPVGGVGLNGVRVQTNSGGTLYAPNVGVATNSPQTPLHVHGAGTIGLMDSSTPGQLTVRGGGSGVDILRLARTGFTYGFALNSSALAVTDAGIGQTLLSSFQSGNVPSLMLGIRPSGSQAVGGTNGFLTAEDADYGTTASNLSGGTLTISSGKGTGQGTLSDVIIQTPDLHAAASTNQQPISTKLIVRGSGPVVQIKTQMDTNQPIGCYGAMMMPLTNILAIGPTAYTNINGYSVCNTNQFRYNTNTGTISNVFAGYYRMTISASILGGAGDFLEGCLLTNGVDSECISFYKAYDPGTARFDVMSASGLLYLPTNCQCSFALKKTTAGNVAIRRAAIVIGTP